MGRYVEQLLYDATAPVTSFIAKNRNANGTSIQVILTGTSGPVQASVTLYGSHKNEVPDAGAMTTITLGDGVMTSDTKLTFLSADYPFYHAVLNSISGTGAKLNLYIGH